MSQNDEFRFSRRQLLASASVVGAAGLGFARGNRRVSGTDPSYPNVTYAATQGPSLRVGWHATYDDGREEDPLRSVSPGTDEWSHGDTDAYANELDEDGPAGPVIDFGDVVPGDSGTLSVGLYVDADSEPGTVWVRRTLAGESALASAVDVELWYDTGLFGVGGCRGADASGFGEPVVTGTLAAPETTLAATGTFDEGLRLDPGLASARCLEPGERLCLGFSWALDENVGNAYQGAGTQFALEFGAVGCDFAGNPFVVEPWGGEQ
ncbi:hypothetical protein GCM10027435_04130 [Haloparvum alkalitolerans]|uniref:hypothetical protein n=1 Tax=Haloparvum alkalitolerans TaxID=1042953 RepID=UPI003CF686BA